MEFLDLVYRGVYSIDDDGNIWHNGFNRQGKFYTYQPKRLVGRENHAGYLTFHFRTLSGKQYQCSNHVAVYAYHKRRPRTEDVVLHLDGDKKNNHPSNLDVVSRKEIAEINAGYFRPHPTPVDYRIVVEVKSRASRRSPAPQE